MRRAVHLVAAGFCVFVFAMLAPVAPALAFPDVHASHSNAEAIDTLYSECVISGYADGRFGPSDPIRRF